MIIRVKKTFYFVQRKSRELHWMTENVSLSWSQEHRAKMSSRERRGGGRGRGGRETERGGRWIQSGRGREEKEGEEKREGRRAEGETGRQTNTGKEGHLHRTRDRHTAWGSWFGANESQSLQV